MRGDSLRDFQAKVLAIAGLGVLAGVGALVDYWPTGNNLPAMIGSHVARPDVPVPTPASIAAARQRDAIEVAVPMAAVAMTGRATRAPQPVVLDSVVAVAGASPIGETVALGSVDLPLPSIPAAVPVPVTDPPAQSISLPDPPVSSVDRTPAYAPTFTAPDNDPGFVMGTLRKTGSSIAKGGAVTGASIMDVFRGVAGAFRKVSPFKDRGFSESN